MSAPTYKLSTDFEIPSGFPTAQREVGPLTVETSSLCIGRAMQISTEIENAILSGGIPTAQLLITQKVRESQQNSIPLTCILSFGS